MVPPEAEEFYWDDPRATASLDWILLISSLNSSFWSDQCGSERYGVKLRESWTSGERNEERVEVFARYCSLVAAINRDLSSFFEGGFRMIVFDARPLSCTYSFSLASPKPARAFWLSTALEEDIPFVDPEFYPTCPGEIIAHIFRPAPRSKESIPLLKQRIAIMCENGRILVKVNHPLGDFLLNWLMLILWTRITAARLQI